MKVNTRHPRTRLISVLLLLPKGLDIFQGLRFIAFWC
jgi:hypothetical protein